MESHALPDASVAPSARSPLALRMTAGGRHRAIALRRWFSAGDGWLVVVLIALPVLVRTPALLGLTHTNAIGYTAGLGAATPGFVPGQPTIDPNIGFTAQALGAQAAQQWAHGQVPWWNPYEGVGMPLAGEMQAAAFFPLTLLLLAPWGQLAFHVCLQIIAGIATCYLLRQLGLSRVAALTGGVLFEFNGVFAWLGNAVVNPVPFLPLLLLGVERAFVSARSEPVTDATRARSSWGVARGVWSAAANGWAWIAVALALSLVAGFPEVAYLDGLLAACWVIARLIALRGWLARGRFALKLCVGFVVGAALTAPLLVAFVQYLREANSGLHTQGTSALDLPPLTLAQLLHPYIYGAIFQFQQPFGVMIAWANIGGYLGATVAFLALMGVFARRDLTLRIALAAWIALAIGRTMGVEPFAFILNHIPLMNTVAVYRYINASWVMAAVVLAALALDDWRGSQRDKIKAALCAVVTLGVFSLGSLWLAQPTLQALFANPLFSKKRAVGSVAIEWTAILILLSALLYGRDRFTDPVDMVGTRAQCVWRRVRGVLRARPHALLLGVVAAALSVGYFAYPTLANPRQAPVDTTAVHYLQAHAGYQRFFTLGPFAPNYGSYFDVASVNHNDVPVAQRWVAYVQAHLDPYLIPALFINIPRDSPTTPTVSDEVVAHLSEYEAIGVKYILTAPGAQPFAQLPASQRPTLVYQDSVMWIYQTRSPAPLFSANGAACQTRVVSWTEARVNCPSATTLVYRTMADAGWHAAVNGHPASITTDANGLFQDIAVPAGASRVTFWYEPPHEAPAMVAAILALLALVGSTLAALRRQSRGPGRATRRSGEPRAAGA